MAAEEVIKWIDRQDWAGEASETLQPLIRQLFESGGDAGKALKDFLHGTWLGHPLHAALIDLPLGSWNAAAIFDALSLITDDDGLRKAADAAIALGIGGATLAAIAGVTDWSETDDPAKKVGLMHAGLNVAALSLFIASYTARKRDKRSTGIGLSLLGWMIGNASAFLGGHLTYSMQIGVDHTADKNYPKEFTRALAVADLLEDTPTKAKAGDEEIVLFRNGETIRALAQTCPHLGGPLSEGRFDGETIACPWHGSTFSIEDGSIVHGPATGPAPCFDVRVRDGWVEVKRRM